MRAIVLRRFGGPEVLEVGDAPIPPLRADDDVLVRVAAVSVGRLLDLSSRAGTHPYAKIELPHILGAEHAGLVAAIGPAVRHVEVGELVAVFPPVACQRCSWCRDGREEVCPSLAVTGVHRPGAYAEYCVSPERNLQRVPPTVGPAEAAALALAGPVADNQLTQAGFRPGDWVLVQGAASALGSLTAALAAFRGAKVIGTARSAHKRAKLTSLGIAAILDTTGGHFVEEVKNLTDGHGVAIAVDNLGDPTVWESSIQALAEGGTVVSSGAFLGGAATVDLARLYTHNQRLIGIRTGNLASVHRVWRDVEAGFRPIVDRTFPIWQASDAHRYLERSDNIGRVVLTTDADTWYPTAR